MAITGSGFDGTMNEAQFAKLMTLAGVRYAVGSSADFAATQVPGIRSVSISAGDAYAAGVLVTSTEVERITLYSPENGQWYLIVLQRWWSINSCDLAVYSGSSTSSTIPTEPPSTYPEDMRSTPGITDDQPLYWAWVNSTTTTVKLFDVRTMGGSTTGFVKLSSGVTSDFVSLTRTGNIASLHISNAQRTAAWTNAVTVATIPVGFRPAQGAPVTTLNGASGNGRSGLVTPGGGLLAYGETGAGSSGRLSFNGSWPVA